jgi:hypothetical protein
MNVWFIAGGETAAVAAVRRLDARPDIRSVS